MELYKIGISPQLGSCGKSQTKFSIDNRVVSLYTQIFSYYYLFRSPG